MAWWGLRGARRQCWGPMTGNEFAQLMRAMRRSAPSRASGPSTTVATRLSILPEYVYELGADVSWERRVCNDMEARRERQ